MKNTLLILAMLVCSQLRAQSNSRLIFIYNSKDAAPDAVLCHNGQPTDTLHPNTTLLKEGAHLAGAWSMRPVTAPADAKMVLLNLSAIDNKLAIIQFIPGKESDFPVWPYVMNLEQFHKMFKHEKWLKEQIREAGYHKSDDVLTGFTPYIFPQPKDVPYVRKPQPAHPGDTIFYDGFSDITIRDSAMFYRVAGNSGVDGTFPFTDYFFTNNKLKQVGFLADLDSLKLTGKATSYYKSGLILFNGEYKNGQREGNFEMFYDTAGSPKWYTEHYTEGRLDGMLTSYYRNGQLKRTENHLPFKIAAQTKYGLDYWKDSITSGICYDIAGNKIPFTPFLSMPVCEFDVVAYLSGTLHYPEYARERAIQGRAVIKFMVTEEGRVYYPKVSRSVTQCIDIEAWRAIYNMPNWKPGLQDGEQVTTIFSQPISFKLE